MGQLSGGWQRKLPATFFVELRAMSHELLASSRQLSAFSQELRNLAEYAQFRTQSALLGAFLYLSVCAES